MGLVYCTSSFSQGGYSAQVGQVFEDTSYVVATYPSYFSDPTDVQVTGPLKVGTAADAFAVKGQYLTAAIDVAVPSITDPDIAKVDVDIAAAGSLTFAAALGDAVVAIPQGTIVTNARLQSAYVIGADSIRVTFGSEGGNVTGENNSFKFLITDLT